jgi:Zn-dependent oligopeptidase
MSKNAAAVYKMYDELIPRLVPPAHAELAVLKALKETEKKERAEHFDAKINSWGTQFTRFTSTKVQILTQQALLDFNYYHTLLKQRKYTIDEDVVRTYFPLAKVKAGLLEAYQTILSLIFTKVEKPEDSCAAPVWHPDVEMWEVHDAVSKEFVGYFYLDLFPREGAHFTCFTGKKVQVLPASVPCTFVPVKQVK